MKKKLNILITGGAGYLGSMITTELVNLGHNVQVLDKLEYSKNSLCHLFIYKNFNLVEGNVLNKKLFKKLIKNKDIIIPLAALVGAPLCDNNKKLAIEVNLNSIKFLLKVIKSGQKILYPTTNSGYGKSNIDNLCTEESPLNPISLYGTTKVEAEKIILKQHKNSVCFRLATVFGFSYRMRTDLLVNNFVLNALKKNQLLLFEPNFRRNYIHVRDVSNAMVFAINNFKKMRSNTFNLGLSNANLTKIQLAKKIKKRIKNLKIKIIKNKKDPDQRDYFVSNKKIERAGFKPKYSIEMGINELIALYNFSNTNFKNNY